MYPTSFASISIARILLCITMLLTFPLPFFTCREMIILSFLSGNSSNDNATLTEETATAPTTTARNSSLEETSGTDIQAAGSPLTSDLEQPLLSDQDVLEEENDNDPVETIACDNLQEVPQVSYNTRLRYVLIKIYADSVTLDYYTFSRMQRGPR